MNLEKTNKQTAKSFEAVHTDSLKTKERNSNIELLRILSMLAIVSGHFIGQSGILDNANGISKFILYIIGFGQRIAVNIFLIIGTWFMVDRDFKAKRVVKLYSQVFIYTVTITTIMLIVGGVNTSTKDILRGYLPFFGRALWFASAYITLILLTPYLKKVFLMEEKKIFKLLCLLFIFISVVSTLPDRQEVYLCNCLWFIFMYLLIGWFKLYKYEQIKKDNNKNWLYLLIGIGIYLILTIFLFLVQQNEALTKLTLQYLEDIKTIPNLLSAICIFLFFLNIKPHNNKMINVIARTSFGVYIIHQVPAFINFLWFNICKVENFYNSDYLIIYTIGVILFVYIFASIIDNIRIIFLEPKWEKSKIFNKICNKIDEFY